MRIRKPGKVLHNLWYLGREQAGVYLLDGGDEAMIERILTLAKDNRDALGS